MKAMVFDGETNGLTFQDVHTPVTGPGQLGIRVEACGVCRTDLHLVEGDLPSPNLPIIPGHEIVGRIDSMGAAVKGFRLGQRVGVPWLGHTCGGCPYCTGGHENLCDEPGLTGYTINGGFAEFTVADASYCFALDEEEDPAHLAPLLCAGLIGYRSYRMAGDGQRLGLFGFGAAAHILTQLAVFDGRDVYAFTRCGDIQSQDFARSLGACWADCSLHHPPELLDTAILFAPVGDLVPRALRAVRKGGRVICGGVHMTDIPSFSYADLWSERSIQSVANLTRQDGLEFFPKAKAAGIKTSIVRYPLADANAALADLKEGAFDGAAVLLP